MKKETLKKFGKPMALLATIGALLTSTGCTTHYVNGKGEIVGSYNNAGDVARVMEGVGSFLYGAGAATSAAADIVHAARGGHRHHHRTYYGRYVTPAPVVVAPVVTTPVVVRPAPVVVAPVVQWCR